MNVLVIGTGGREHALVWKIAQSARVKRIYCPGGNAGISALADTAPIAQGENFSGLIDFARRENIGLTVVGPEAPLAAGIVDVFEEAGLKIFGPNKAAAQIEASKDFCKDVLLSAHVPTGAAQSFCETAAALKYLETREFPIVIKADGLAAGKGVVLAPNRETAEKTIRSFLDENALGKAGKKILIEEFLRGEEASLLAFTDGETVLPMDNAQDHKAIGDGDTGPNTGGMGAYSPAPVVTPELYQRCLNEIFIPTVSEMNRRGIKYKGVLYAGLMISGANPKVLEYNCRFGDPETQALLPRLKNDLVDVMMAAVEGRLSQIKLEWRPEPAVCVVMASKGYPEQYEKGKTITGLERAISTPERIIFHAGTKWQDGKVVTSGGRVLGATALAETLPKAIDAAYRLVGEIDFDNKYYRTDIGQKALKRM
ncbi:MAG TPA: phosphoribosylamine--glycine ligase [Candidatus Sumerlaeota bacterium]|nr:MAG: Phosphoribosylamine--glycine ligase [candidate division BRC1 bacterium ADurb.Bin183]HOE63896.1 phosphoribosylamine--glycine ligase [Candidatus Sumerlaeota bacterium]HRR31584.1 phosphoribosylamine--glycine ligase [Candidatus Sumerlaeia bacterium]HON51182.1 phosphoribosylamine--glycine ligase [Candidatus Sumerlaeota bacterium]HOR64501.1 phosphoribosylamine--glycine ligase [Candidatus Sumerlaeota bacterium]